jgi:hypothetical protein
VAPVESEISKDPESLDTPMLQPEDPDCPDGT